MASYWLPGKKVSRYLTSLKRKKSLLTDKQNTAVQYKDKNEEYFCYFNSEMVVNSDKQPSEIRNIFQSWHDI
jgi:hypothetical protein